MAGLLLAAMLVLLIAGCASAQDEPLPAVCLDGPATIVLALQPAPQAVRLADGTRLSTCVSRARTNGELQELGVSLTTAADTLRAQVVSDPGAAAALGYLAGAVRGGAQSNQAFASELQRRIERATALATDAAPAAQAALTRGLQEGERDG